MARVFKTRAFVSAMKKSGITDTALCKAVPEMRRGLIDADLRGGVVKKRVAIPARGNSGGARKMLASNRGSRRFFVYGFLKNERANISPTELEALKLLAADPLSFRDAQLERVAATGELTEICNDN